MEKSRLYLAAALSILAGSVLLTEGRTNAAREGNVAAASPSPTPTPVAASPKVPCMMPARKDAVQGPPAPTPTPRPWINDTSPPELRISDLIEIQKTLDWDCDGVSNYEDNCTEVYNPDQKGGNKNGFGDACQPKKPRGKSRRRVGR